jgi:hypothetical protein
VIWVCSPDLGKYTECFAGKSFVKRPFDWRWVDNAEINLMDYGFGYMNLNPRDVLLYLLF